MVWRFGVCFWFSPRMKVSFKIHEDSPIDMNGLKWHDAARRIQSNQATMLYIHRHPVLDTGSPFEDMVLLGYYC